MIAWWWAVAYAIVAAMVGLVSGVLLGNRALDLLEQRIELTERYARELRVRMDQMETE